MDKGEEKLKFLLETIPQIEKDRDVKVVLAFVRGSHMYGTNTEKSDVDITFVYQQKTDDILRGNYKEQITVGGNDIVGYEVQRFLNLLGTNNPNILEALDIPHDCLIYKHPKMDLILDQSTWLSKLTEKTILGYADSQIKKATRLNKNMNKNMMHLFRLLSMAFHVAVDKKIRVRDQDPDWLLEIRSGSMEYDTLMEDAKGLFEIVKDMYSMTDLQDAPDPEKVKDLILKFRKDEELSK